MKVIIGKNGVSGKVVNDKANISHEIEKKTSLSKRTGGEIGGKNLRTVGVEKSVKNAENSAPNIPKPVERKRAFYSGNAPRNSSVPTPVECTSKSFSGNAPKSSSVPTPVERTSKPFSGNLPRNSSVPIPAPRTSKSFSGSAPSVYHNRTSNLRLAPRGKYKVLRNGAVEKNVLTKKKARAINSKKAAKLKKAKLKKLKKQRIKFNREQAQIGAFAFGGGGKNAPKMTKFSKAVGGAKKAVNLAKKPVDKLKRGFYAQADKSDDNGVKAAKLGLEIKDYGVSGVKTAVRGGEKIIKGGTKLTKRVYRKIHKPTSAELRRKLRKQITRKNIGTQAKFLAKRAVKNGAKTAGQAAAKATKTGAKATAKAAARAAKLAAKAAQAAARAVAQAVAKIASLIAETMPYSLFVIAAILLIVLMALMVGSFVSSAGGSVAGGGAWLVDDSSDQTPEEIYDGYKEFVEQAKDVMETQAKDALKNEVDDFCGGDTSDPRKIIQYIDKGHDVTFYPASGANSTIDGYIELFGTDDYADYMSLLFVLMTREKQQADGVTDEEIYDFDFKKSDFEEFMKTVNENSCRWGDTFVIKTTEETSGNACPNENCKTKTISGCHCASRTDKNGKVHHYCGGHAYCPKNHTKLTVKLYTVKDYYGKEYPEIYKFTENEKARYEASKAVIQGLLDYWEENGE